MKQETHNKQLTTNNIQQTTEKKQPIAKHQQLTTPLTNQPINYLANPTDEPTSQQQVTSNTQPKTGTEQRTTNNKQQTTHNKQQKKQTTNNIHQRPKLGAQTGPTAEALRGL